MDAPTHGFARVHHRSYSICINDNIPNLTWLYPSSPTFHRQTTSAKQIDIKVAGQAALSGATVDLRDAWEETAFMLERLQCAEECVEAEQKAQRTRTAPKWHLPFKPTWTPEEKMKATDKVRVAIIREEGSNGDREMSAAAFAAGMEPWDITMSDLLNGRAQLDSFRGIIFVGGFSYADTLDSAKGWAGELLALERGVLADCDQSCLWMFLLSGLCLPAAA